MFHGREEAGEGDHVFCIEALALEVSSIQQNTKK